MTPGGRRGRVLTLSGSAIIVAMALGSAAAGSPRRPAPPAAARRPPRVPAWPPRHPTITASPDHGDVWSRPWTVDEHGMATYTGDFELARAVRVGQQVRVDYRLRGPAGALFTWAFHALLTPEVGTRIEVAGSTSGAPTRCRVWPRVGEVVDTWWPTVLDTVDGDVLGPDDGSLRWRLVISSV